MAQGGNEIMGENEREDTINIRTKPCWICGQYSYLDIPWDAWCLHDVHNIHIEIAWPQGSAEDKQLLRTGIHPKCWDHEFPEPLEGEK